MLFRSVDRCGEGEAEVLDDEEDEPLVELLRVSPESPHKQVHVSFTALDLSSGASAPLVEVQRAQARLLGYVVRAQDVREQEWGGSGEVRKQDLRCGRLAEEGELAEEGRRPRRIRCGTLASAPFLRG